jgi:hypothetical protein
LKINKVTGSQDDESVGEPEEEILVNPSAALLALSKNRGLKPLAQPGGQFIDLVIAVNLDGFLRCTQGDYAVLASLEVDLQIGDQASRNLVIEKIAELRQKL